MLEKHNIQLSEYEAQYYEAGAGFPLIFLHGFFGNGTHWHPLIDRLQPHYRCIALDLLGFGGSSKPELNYNIWHQVEFLKEFLARLDLKEYSLLGHSYGGWTASAFALQANPHQLKNITLLAPAGIRDDEFVGRYNHLRPLLWKTALVDWGLALLYPLALVTGQRQGLASVRNIRIQLLEQPVAASSLRDRLKPEDAIDTVEKELHNINVPTFIFAGEQDLTIPLWHCEAYAEGVENSQLFTYQDAEHDLIQTHVAPISETLLKVLPSCLNHR